MTADVECRPATFSIDKELGIASANWVLANNVAKFWQARFENFMVRPIIVFWSWRHGLQNVWADH